MSQQLNTLLRDKAWARWTALILLAAAMFFAYIFVDILSPLQASLQSLKGWDPSAYGHYTGSEMFLNVFVFFLIFAGVILDKMGVRFTAILSGCVMLVGAFVNYYALTDSFAGSSLEVWFTNNFNIPVAWWNVTPWYEGMPASAKLSAIGFMLFGCGTDMAGITVSRGIVKWFEGKEMALAMGVEMAIARVGVAVVFLASPALAKFGGVLSVSRPVGFTVLLLLIGLICFITYAFMDKKLEKQMGGNGEVADDPFKISDLKHIISSKVFWIVALLCVLYYSAIFPFQKYANNMLQCNLGISSEQASLIFFVFPLGAAFITPFLGNFLDRRGKGATMLIFGAILMIVCHLTFAFGLPAMKGETPTQIGEDTMITCNIQGISIGDAASRHDAEVVFSVKNLANPGAASDFIGKKIGDKVMINPQSVCVASGENVAVPEDLQKVHSRMAELLTCDLSQIQSGEIKARPYEATITKLVAPSGMAGIIIAYLSIILLGISFSLVPASLWPSVPKLVDGKLLGSAYAVIFWIQNIGLYAFPMIIGGVLASTNPGIFNPLNYNYTVPMVLFASLGVFALIFGLTLKRLDAKKHYGLELPNVKGNVEAAEAEMLAAEE